MDLQELKNKYDSNIQIMTNTFLQAEVSSSIDHSLIFVITKVSKNKKFLDKYHTNHTIKECNINGFRYL